MALLQVDEIKPGPGRQHRRLDVAILQPIELGVGNERKVWPGRRAGGLVDDRSRIQQRIVLGENRPATAIAAGMGELKANQEVIVAAARLDVGGSGHLQRVARSQRGCSR